MAILNYTTKIDAEKTINEITKMLVKHGANRIVTSYDENRLPCAVSFSINWNGQLLPFLLPCNYEGVFASLKSSDAPKHNKTKEQAIRTSWRIVKDWVEAQLAIVEANLSKIEEVFLPYVVTNNGQTLFEKFEAQSQKLLSQ